MVMGRRALLLAGAAVPVSGPAHAQCVTDTLVVDACLGGVRRTVPGGMTLDLNFMAAPLDPRITFSRASTATYTDASGTIQTAAVNAPRWDYANGVLRGLLIEEARTNLAVYSATFTTWAALDSTVTQSSGTAPDGTNSMARLSEAATNNFHLIYFLLTTPASTACTVSVYAKAVQARYLTMTLDDASATGGYATFDLQAGVISGAMAAIGPGVIGPATIQPVGNGVYRCSITTTIGAATAARALLALCNVPNPGTQFPVYPGNVANGLLLWGAQIEVGAFATSYIPTAAATVTRSADQCSISSANMAGWFVSPGGTWFAEFIDLDTTATTSNIMGPPGVGGSVLPLYVTGGFNLAQWDGGTPLQTVNTVVVGAVSKGTAGYLSGSARTCLNGGVVASGVLSSGYPGLAASGVGFLTSSPTSTENMTAGYLRRVRYWPRLLSNAEMQQVTT
jgi:hypothetical protein